MIHCFGVCLLVSIKGEFLYHDVSTFVDSDGAGGRASSCRLAHGSRRFWQWKRDDGHFIHGDETRRTAAPGGSSSRTGKPGWQDGVRTAILLVRAARSDPREVGKHDEACGGGAPEPPLPDAGGAWKMRLQKYLFSSLFFFFGPS